MMCTKSGFAQYLMLIYLACHPASLAITKAKCVPRPPQPECRVYYKKTRTRRIRPTYLHTYLCLYL